MIPENQALKLGNLAAKLLFAKFCIGQCFRTAAFSDLFGHKTCPQLIYSDPSKFFSPSVVFFASRIPLVIVLEGFDPLLVLRVNLFAQCRLCQSRLVQWLSFVIVDPPCIRPKIENMISSKNWFPEAPPSIKPLPGLHVYPDRGFRHAIRTGRVNRAF
jgi:hypothetical protein